MIKLNDHAVYMSGILYYFCVFFLSFYNELGYTNERSILGRSVRDLGMMTGVFERGIRAYTTDDICIFLYIQNTPGLKVLSPENT